MIAKRKRLPKKPLSKNYDYCIRKLSEMEEGTQNYLVLNHILTHGSVTAWEMATKYGIMATHSRISDLRNDWLIPIHKEMVYKNGKTYGVYTIEVD